MLAGKLVAARAPEFGQVSASAVIGTHLVPGETSCNNRAVAACENNNGVVAQLLVVNPLQQLTRRG